MKRCLRTNAIRCKNAIMEVRRKMNDDARVKNEIGDQLGNNDWLSLYNGTNSWRNVTKNDAFTQRRLRMCLENEKCSWTCTNWCMILFTKNKLFSLIAKFPQKLWIFMKNVSDHFNAEFYVLSEYAMINTTLHLKKQNWPSYDLQFDLHQKLKPIILCPPPNPTTFVSNIFL